MREKNFFAIYFFSSLIPSVRGSNGPSVGDLISNPAETASVSVNDMRGSPSFVDDALIWLSFFGLFLVMIFGCCFLCGCWVVGGAEDTTGPVSIVFSFGAVASGAEAAAGGCIV